MDIGIIINKTPDVIMRGIASRVKDRRLERNLTQKAFAKRAGVGYDAYRKFETTGEITLRNLVLCAIVLDMTEGFLELFSGRSFQSIDELLEKKETKKRQRGSRNG
ncbi:XRE family transcriptional regulator [Dysgonomonas sp. 521]|uniref:helix-turn-helix domain-containing protein n=1 Tax=Dysgonomonas sp. 521 TaxID=2302932 RepID=UPI0013D5038D|nr:XRE family transcriptional regulator [Dysgonomonas sp. 521]